jgi:hypothetical protein
MLTPLGVIAGLLLLLMLLRCPLKEAAWFLALPIVHTVLPPLPAVPPTGLLPKTARVLGDMAKLSGAALLLDVPPPAVLPDMAVRLLGDMMGLTGGTLWESFFTEAFQEGLGLTDASGVLLWWLWYSVATRGSGRRPAPPERPLAMLLLLLMGLQADALLIGEGGSCSRLCIDALLTLLVSSSCCIDLAVRPTARGACCCC